MNIPAEIDPDFEHQKLQELAKLPMGDILFSFIYRLESSDEQLDTSEPDLLSQYSVKDLLDAIKIQLEHGSVEAEEIKSHFGPLFAQHQEKLRPFEQEIEAIMAMNIVSAEPAPTEVVEKPESKKKPWHKRRGLVLGAALTALTAADYGRHLINAHEDDEIGFATWRKAFKLLTDAKIPEVEQQTCQEKAEREAILTEAHILDAAFVLPYYAVHKMDRSRYLTLGFVLDDISDRRGASLFYAENKAKLACIKKLIQERAKTIIKPEPEK